MGECLEREGETEKEPSEDRERDRSTTDKSRGRELLTVERTEKETQRVRAIINSLLQAGMQKNREAESPTKELKFC